MEKVRKKCANSRESAAGPGSRGDSGLQEESGLWSRDSGLGNGTRVTRPDSHNE